MTFTFAGMNFSSRRTNSVPIVSSGVPQTPQIRSSSGTSRNTCSTGRPFKRSSLAARFFRGFASVSSQVRRVSSERAATGFSVVSVSASLNRFSCPGISHLPFSLDAPKMRFVRQPICSFRLSRSWHRAASRALAASIVCCSVLISLFSSDIVSFVSA